VFEVAARINNVQYNTSKQIALPISSGAQPSATAMTTSRPLDNGVFSTTSVHQATLLFVSAIVGVVLGSSLLFL